MNYECKNWRFICWASNFINRDVNALNHRPWVSGSSTNSAITYYQPFEKPFPQSNFIGAATAEAFNTWLSKQLQPPATPPALQQNNSKKGGEK